MPGTILPSSEWKRLRKETFKIKTGRIKASVGKQLRVYHAAKSIEKKLAAIIKLEAALAKYQKGLDPEVESEAIFIADIDAILDAVARREAKLLVYQRLAKREMKSLDVATIVASKSLTQCFMRFCERIHIDNEFGFILAVARGESKDSIYETYIDDDSNSQVNISSSVKKPLDSLAQADDYRSMNFAASAAAVTKTIDDDPAKLFYNSDEFQEYLRTKLGSKVK